MYTPVNPIFTIIKVGCKGLFITRTCYHDVNCYFDCTSGLVSGLVSNHDDRFSCDLAHIIRVTLRF